MAVFPGVHSTNAFWVVIRSGSGFYFSLIQILITDSDVSSDMRRLLSMYCRDICINVWRNYCHGKNYSEKTFPMMTSSNGNISRITGPLSQSLATDMRRLFYSTWPPSFSSYIACYRYATPFLFNVATVVLFLYRLLPICDAFFIQRGHRRSLPILRKKLLNGQTPEMKSQPLEQSSCLETQSQLEQSIARKREIRCEKFQNLTNVFR